MLEQIKQYIIHLISFSDIKYSICTMLEALGLGTFFVSIFTYFSKYSPVELAQAFSFACGGLSFLIGSVIKFLDLRLKSKQQNGKGRN